MITINLMRDNNSPDCERIVEWTKSHILALNQDLICPLPDNFEDYWKYGTMKFMLIEILRNKIGKWNNRYFSYGTKSFLDKNLRYFCENLGLKLLGRQIING